MRYRRRLHPLDVGHVVGVSQRIDLAVTDGMEMLVDLGHGLILDAPQAFHSNSPPPIIRTKIAATAADARLGAAAGPTQAWAWQAIADWKHALRLDPTHAWTYDSLAWIHAASEDSKYRNGTKAVEYATKACQLTDWTEPFSLATLAQAHAECGQFGQAVRWQKKALDLAPAEQKADFQLQLESLMSRQRGEDFPNLPDDSDETPP